MRPYTCVRPNYRQEQCYVHWRDYQLSAIKHLESLLMKHHYVLMLCMKCGSGKTLVSLMFADIACRLTKGKKTVVFVTSEVIFDDVRSDFNKLNINSYDLKLCTVRQIHRETSAHVVIVDESHTVYTRKKTCEAIRRLQCITLLLTGTPGIPREQTCQLKPFCTNIDTPRVVNMMDESDFTARVTERVLRMQLSAEHRRDYNDWCASIRTMKKLLQHNAITKLRNWLARLKVARAVSIIKQCVEHKTKVLVISNFTDVLLQLAARLPASRLYLAGVKDRKRQLHDFKHQASCYVLLCSASLASHALNLGFVSKMLLLDTMYKPVEQYQAMNRIKRVNSVYEQEICKLVFTETVEDKLDSSHGFFQAHDDMF